jgi:membrane associated rhomboid family serine protease
MAPKPAAVGNINTVAAPSTHRDKVLTVALAGAMALAVFFLNVAYKSEGRTEAVELGISIALFGVAGAIIVFGIVSDHRMRRKRRDLGGGDSATD